VLAAANKIKADNANKTDAQIGQQALQLAMAAKQLRVYAKELKELLIYSGNGDIWDEMLAEQTRLVKERKEFLRKQAISDKKKKEQRKPWSREEEELLLELRRSGHLIREISKIMNRSEASVLKRSQKILDLNKVERPRYFRKSKT
jgi:DNA-binding NarL/FixJ family response regulator